MSIRRIGAIIIKDFRGGLGRTFFLLAVIVPVLMTLVINLIFGRLFTEKPTLAVWDRGNSDVTAKIKALDSVIIEDVQSEEQLREKVKNGAIDGGIVLPQDFDRQLESHALPKVIAFIGGESLASNRIALAVSLADIMREEAGQEVPIKLVETPLGKEAELPIKVKIIPLLVLYAIFIGGCTLPISMIVDEVQKKTVSAVTVTPATLSEMLAAKAIVGFLTSFVMGMVILVINQVLVGNVWLLLIFMLLGSVFAVELGLIFGQISRDMTTGLTYVKLIGFVAFIPALLLFCPQVPEWVSQIFPTYYLFDPIIQITQHGAALPDVWLDAVILLAFDLFFVIFVALSKRKLERAV